MRTFRVYFLDGNQMLFEVCHIGAIILKIHDYSDTDGAYTLSDIYKIEEVTQEDK